MADDMIDSDDSLAGHTPRWLRTLVATIAEVVLVVVTVGIITAMWFPAYLSSRASAKPVDHSRDEMMFGMFPRGR